VARCGRFLLCLQAAQRTHRGRLQRTMDAALHRLDALVNVFPTAAAEAAAS
jgi:hypothetical protein